MGRSFDRGGRSRKERMRGKRRAYQQAERDREAREAVMQARREALLARGRRPQPAAPVLSAAAVRDVPLARPAAITAVIDQKRPGFFTRVFKRMLGKAA
jgi:hypothetical protein